MAFYGILRDCLKQLLTHFYKICIAPGHFPKSNKEIVFVIIHLK